MRMWNLDPALLCEKHLLGEHFELHKLAGCLRKGIIIRGYVNHGLVEVHNIAKRHEELVKEMIIRGMNHKSPLGAFPASKQGHVDTDKSRRDLIKRCKRCAERIQKEEALK